MLTILLLQESAGCASIIDTDSKLEDWEEMVSSTKASSNFFQFCLQLHRILSYLLLKWLLNAFRHSHTPTNTICFYFSAQVSKYQVKALRVCYICVLTIPFNDHLNSIWIDTVFFGMLPIVGDPLPPQKSCSPIHTPPSTWPPKACVHHGAVLKARTGKGGRDSWFWAPVCETWKPTLTPWSFHFFWVCLVLFPFTVSFSTPPPVPCSFLFSDTPPPPFPFALRTVCQGEHPFLSALLSTALLSESVPSRVLSFVLSSVHVFLGLALSVFEINSSVFFCFFLLWHWQTLNPIIRCIPTF